MFCFGWRGEERRRLDHLRHDCTGKEEQRRPIIEKFSGNKKGEFPGGHLFSITLGCVSEKKEQKQRAFSITAAKRSVLAIHEKREKKGKKGKSFLLRFAGLRVHSGEGNRAFPTPGVPKGKKGGCKISELREGGKKKGGGGTEPSTTASLEKKSGEKKDWRM